MPQSEQTPLTHEEVVDQIQKSLADHPQLQVDRLEGKPGVLQSLEVETGAVFQVKHPAVAYELLIVATPTTVAQPAELLLMFALEKLELPQDKRPVRYYQNQIVSSYQIKWLTRGGSMDIDVTAEELPDRHVFVSLNKNTPISQYTPTTLTTELERFVSFFDLLADS